MKIAMIGQKCVPAVSGGVERHVEELGRRLAEKGHTVTVYNRRGYADKNLKEYAGIHLEEVYTFKNKYLEAVVYAFLASVRAIRDGQEIIHYHALGPASMGFIPRLLGRKVVTTVHGLDWQRAKWGFFAKAYLKLGEIIALTMSTRTIVVSQKLKIYLEAKYNRRASKIRYIPNGVTPAEHLPVRLISEKYGLTKNGYILFLARLVPEKGCHHLLRAFCGIETNIKLVIAGGSSYSDAYCDQLKNYESNNIIFTGEVHGDLIKELYSNALFYVLPSEIEGMPISLLEAMSYGLCPLVSDIDENIEVIASGTGVGFSFKSAYVGALKDKLEYMLANLEEINERGKRAKQLVSELYKWDSVTTNTENLYLELRNKS